MPDNNGTTVACGITPEGTLADMNRDTLTRALAQVGTLADIAAQLGLTSEALYRLERKYESFPDPVGEIAASRVYVVEEVLSWHRDVGRIYGRAGS